MKMEFDWSGFKVEVENLGVDASPWHKGEYAPVFVYKVRVERDGISYETKAWGSIYDNMHGRSDRHEEMGAMVLDELASAYADPDEFARMAIEGNPDITVDRLRLVANLIDKANEFGEPLIDAANSLRESEVL